MQYRDLALAPRYDLIIVGGGATGLGSAVDAATRGYRVLLIEQHDFAKGTSSRSTKLIHGGVRYLRQGNIPLVREALHERQRLYRNAAALVHSQPFVIPCYKAWEQPFYGAGLLAYDLLAGASATDRSRWLSARTAREALPTVTAKNLRGGVLYYDGQFDDAALALALARAAQAAGAQVWNYVRCERLLLHNGKVVGVVAADVESGQSWEIQAGCVINATGVFADTLRQQAVPSAPPLLRLSQGVHLVLPPRFFPGQHALMLPQTDDGRVLFIIPWQGVVLLGTTDTPVDTAALEPRALPEEIDFLLSHAARYLTEAPTAADVLSVFAGLRPLVQRGSGQSTAALSRDHTIEVGESGLLSVVGGKWTTYRKMAQDVLDRAAPLAGLAPSPCRTADLALPTPPSFTDPADEILWYIRHGQARTVEDILARRTRALLRDARASTEAAESVATLLAQELGWSAARRDEQLRAYRALAKDYIV